MFVERTERLRGRAVVPAALLLVGLFIRDDAQAQVRLPTIPPVQVPTQLPIDPTGAVNAATGALDPNRLRDLRRLRIRHLLRTNRTVLEADPSGAPIVRAEIAVYSPNETSLQLALSVGYTVVRETTLNGLGIKIVILSPRRNQSTRAALKQLRTLDPGGHYDYNHIFIESGFIQIAANDAKDRVTTSNDTANASSAKVGLIDTGVAATHASLQETALQQFGCDSPVPAAHGTAVASLLVGHSAVFSGAAPGAALFVADVYCGRPTGGSVERIASAFSWMHEKRVAVINVSLVGPKNVLLEQIVAAMIARGHLIVAAVGNDGPSAPPLYPAAFPGVVGVTGVDAKRRVLIEAARGPHVYFAAPGADMSAAGMNDDYLAVRGTSFAAPIVAGLLAQKILQPDLQAARDTLAACDRQAIDLGSHGIDPVYGHGLLGETIRVDTRRLAAGKSKE